MKSSKIAFPHPFDKTDSPKSEEWNGSILLSALLFQSNSKSQKVLHFYLLFSYSFSLSVSVSFPFFLWLFEFLSSKFKVLYWTNLNLSQSFLIEKKSATHIFDLTNLSRRNLNHSLLWKTRRICLPSIYPHGFSVTLATFSQISHWNFSCSTRKKTTFRIDHS